MNGNLEKARQAVAAMKDIVEASDERYLEDPKPERVGFTQIELEHYTRLREAVELNAAIATAEALERLSETMDEVAEYLHKIYDVMPSALRS